MSKVVESAKAMMPELIAIRRHFHMYPENSRCEKETSAKVIELFSMETYKDYNHISISIQDNQNCCICDTCAAAKQKYGSDSAVMVMFLNDVAEVVDAWMNSSGHKKNILNSSYTHIGVGHVKSGNFWTQMFIKEK